jgi:hypothetical protein
MKSGLCSQQSLCCHLCRQMSATRRSLIIDARPGEHWVLQGRFLNQPAHWACVPINIPTPK